MEKKTLFIISQFQCPWPLSHNTKEEIQVKEDNDASITSLLSSGTKKRKKDRRRSPLESSISSSLGDSLAENLDKIEKVADKCKSPNSKKLKLTENTNPPTESTESTVDNTNDNSNHKPITSKNKRLGSKEKDIINYLNENFSDSPKPVDVSLTNDEIVSGSDKKTDADYFKAIPVAVRQPIKLPRHASNILSSRHQAHEEDNLVNEETEEDGVDDDVGGSDVECSLLSDLDESDSELESLVR